MNYDLFFKKFKTYIEIPTFYYNTVFDVVSKVYEKKYEDFKIIDIKGELDIIGASEYRDTLAHLLTILEVIEKKNDGRDVEIEIELIFEHIRKGSIETIQNCVKNYCKFFNKIIGKIISNYQFNNISIVNKYSIICGKLLEIKENIAIARERKAHRLEWDENIVSFLKILDSCKELDNLIIKSFPEVMNIEEKHTN